MNRYYLKAALGILVIAVIMMFSAIPGECRGIGTSDTTARMVIDNTRMLVGDASVTAVSDADMLTWVNAAAKLIVSKAMSAQGYTSITLVADTDAYTIAVDYFEISTVQYDSASGTDFEKAYLKKIDPRMLGDMKREAGPPKYWYDWQGYIRVWPEPTSVEASDTLRVDYTANATAIDDYTDTLQTPTFLDHLYELYVAAMYWRHRGQFSVANSFRTEFEYELDRFKIESYSSMVPVATEN